MNISERIIYLRNKQNISQYKLAKLAGISQAGLSNLEQGKKQPTVQTLEKILSALNITWSEFFGENDLPELSPENRRLFDALNVSPPEMRRLIDTIKDYPPERLSLIQQLFDDFNKQK